MSDTPHNGMSCAELQAALAEAVEGGSGLEAGRMGDVRAHVAACSNCGPQFAEAVAGWEWAHALGEVEPPAGLVTRILAATSRSELQSQPQTTLDRKTRDSKAAAASALALAGARKQPHPGAGKATRWGGQWLPPLMAPLLQPRLVATFAMAFFSIALLLNLAGIHITNFRISDLKPSAVRAEVSREYYQTTARVTKYYDSVRLVYELQSRVRELKNAALPQDEQERPRKREKNNRDISIQPGHENNEHYSRQELNSTPTLAEFHPIVMAVQPAPRGLVYRGWRRA